MGWNISIKLRKLFKNSIIFQKVSKKVPGSFQNIWKVLKIFWNYLAFLPSADKKENKLLKRVNPRFDHNKAYQEMYNTIFVDWSFLTGNTRCNKMGKNHEKVKKKKEKLCVCKVSQF